MDRSGSGSSSSSRSARRVRDSGLGLRISCAPATSSRWAMYSLEKAWKSSASSMARAVASIAVDLGQREDLAHVCRALKRRAVRPS